MYVSCGDGREKLASKFVKIFPVNKLHYTAAVVTLLCYRQSTLCVVDLVEIVVTGILAILIAAAATDGTASTCDTLTHNTGHR